MRPATADVGDAFLADGIVTLRSAFSEDDASFLRDAIWRHVEATTPVRLDDPRSWAYDGNFGLRAVERRSIWHVVHRNDAVVAALDAVFGDGRWAKPPDPQILLTFPSKGPWKMPSGWHIDFGFEQQTWPVSAVKLFAFVDHVEAEGGAPLALAGSHRLVHQYAALAGPLAPRTMRSPCIAMLRRSRSPASGVERSPSMSAW